MDETTYKIIELVGVSPNSMEEAVRNALARARSGEPNMLWFELTQTRGRIENGQVTQWQVGLKIGCALDEEVPEQTGLPLEIQEELGNVPKLDPLAPPAGGDLPDLPRQQRSGSS